MNQEIRRKLKDAFAAMVKNMPDPDQPLISFPEELSANEAIKAVENETEAGNTILEILEYGVSVEGIDKVVERLTRKNPPQP